MSHIIDGPTLNNGQVSLKLGLVPTLVSLVTFISRVSTGRKGSMVHLAAVFST